MTFGKVLLISMMAMPGLAIAQQRVPFTVTGSIGKLNAPAKVYLFFGDAAGQVVRDSTLFQNGSFTIKDSVADATLANLVVDATGQGLRYIKRADVLNIYVEPSATVKVVSPDSTQNIKVSGTELNNELQELKVASDKDDKQVKAANPGKNEEELQEIQFESRKLVWKQFIKAHPSSKISLALVRSFAGAGGVIDAAEVQPVFDQLSDTLKNSKEGQQFAAMLKELSKLAIGATAPDFTQTDTSGKPLSLHDFRGKYVLVDFWASWCHPCRMENPNVVKAYEQYKAKNFTIISVSLDRPGDKNKWIDAIHQDHLTWNHVSDLQFWQNQVAQLYAIQSIPQNLLLDPSGRIIAKNLRGDDLADKLKTLNL